MKLLAIAALTLLSVVPSSGVAGAQDPDPDFYMRGVYTYVVKSEDGEIAVEAVFTLSPSPTADADTVQQFSKWGVTISPYVVSSAVDVVAESRGQQLVVNREPADDVGNGPEDRLSIVTAGRHVVDGTVEITLRYSLPGVGLDERGDTVVVDDVFASFPLWSNPFLDSASITVALPPGFSVSGSGSEFRFFDDEDGRRLYMPFAEFYEGRVTVAHHEAFDRSMVGWPSDMALKEGVASNVELRSLPGGDGTWGQAVTETLTVHLPELAELVGQPWPVENLVVTQLSPDHSDSNGYFDQQEATLYVGDPDPYLILQELSGAWFSEDLVESPWLLHALTAGFLESALDGSDAQQPVLLTPDMSSEWKQTLHHYDPGSLTEFEQAWVEETAGWVGRQLVNEAGIAALTNLVAAAEARPRAYGDNGDLGLLDDAPDWRWALDELENDAGVADGPVAALVEDWVATTSLERDRLEERRQARIRLSALDEADGDWIPPMELRLAMSEWNFKRAFELLDGAEAVVRQREELAASVASIGFPVPASIGALYLDASYLGASGGYEEVLEEMRSADAAADTLRDIHASLSKPDAALVDAVALFDAGDFDGAVAAALDAQQAQQPARTMIVGGGIGAAGFVAAGVAVSVVRRRRGNNSGRPSTSGLTSPEPEHTLPSPS